MERMGPEAALLSARLAASLPTRAYRDLELPGEGSMYVEAIVEARLAERRRPALRSPRPGVWARVWGALRGREAAAVPAISAVPIARIEAVRSPGHLAGQAVPLAALPLRYGARR
jgi:hypothetical protein